MSYFPPASPSLPSAFQIINLVNEEEIDIPGVAQIDIARGIFTGVLVSNPVINTNRVIFRTLSVFYSTEVIAIANQILFGYSRSYDGGATWADIGSQIISPPTTGYFSRADGLNAHSFNSVPLNNEIHVRLYVHLSAGSVGDNKIRKSQLTWIAHVRE